MSEWKHTAGPWAVGGNPGELWIEEASSPDRLVVADLTSIPASEENAYLIAAAPDLLQAAEEAETWIRQCFVEVVGGPDPGAVQILAELQPAIARAKGEEA